MKILDLWYVHVWLSKIVLVVYLFTSTDMIFTEDWLLPYTADKRLLEPVPGVHATQ